MLSFDQRDAHELVNAGKLPLSFALLALGPIGYAFQLLLKLLGLVLSILLVAYGFVLLTKCLFSLILERLEPVCKHRELLLQLVSLQLSLFPAFSMLLDRHLGEHEFFL